MSDKTIKHVQRFKNARTGESLVVELEIDIDEVCRHMAARAYGSKVGKSRAMSGDIKCKVLSRGSPLDTVATELSVSKP